MLHTHRRHTTHPRCPRISISIIRFHLPMKTGQRDRKLRKICSFPKVVEVLRWTDSKGKSIHSELPLMHLIKRPPNGPWGKRKGFWVDIDGVSLRVNRPMKVTRPSRAAGAQGAFQGEDPRPLQRSHRIACIHTFCR